MHIRSVLVNARSVNDLSFQNKNQKALFVLLSVVLIDKMVVILLWWWLPRWNFVVGCFSQGYLLEICIWLLVKDLNTRLGRIRGSIAWDIIICTMSKKLYIGSNADWFHFRIYGLFIIFYLPVNCSGHGESLTVGTCIFMVSS